MRSLIAPIQVLAFALPCFISNEAFSQGAISGERYRVLISSDIGGDDEDDDQSFVHYLVYADLFDTEGLVSSPPAKGRAKDFLKVIDIYERDFSTLERYSQRYPSPSFLKSIVKQGALNPAPDSGFSEPTDGSNWIVHCARRNDQRPLYVLVWGAITDLAQALHDAPDIKPKLRVHFIASWNQRQDEHAFRYINTHHPDLWLIHDNSSFRGWYVGGKQSGDLDNKAFVEKHIRNHGKLGNYFYPLKNSSIKMGDSPTVARLLWGDPSDPATESWGGSFDKLEGRPNWWTDSRDPGKAQGDYAGAKTVNKWREDYLRDWEKRLNRLKK